MIHLRSSRDHVGLCGPGGGPAQDGTSGRRRGAHRTKHRGFFQMDELLVPSSFLLLVVRPGAPRSVLASSSDANDAE